MEGHEDEFGDKHRFNYNNFAINGRDSSCQSQTTLSFWFPVAFKRSTIPFLMACFKNNYLTFSCPEESGLTLADENVRFSNGNYKAN